MDHVKLAEELFLKGYNCSQSVFAAFSDITNLDVETSLKVSSGFGAGVCRTRGICGAVSGMIMVLGMINKPEDKALIYSEGQKLIEKFKKENGSHICSILLGVSNTSPIPEKRDETYYKKRPCKELVIMATKMLDEYLLEVL